MASDHFEASIAETPVVEIEKNLSHSNQHGAHIRFHGVVRNIEDGQIIEGIEYSFYQSMALAEIFRIGESMHAQHPDHLALIYHRVGFVAAGDASILIRVQTPHSAPGFELIQEYLKQIKQSVPIWKKPVFG